MDWHWFLMTLTKSLVLAGGTIATLAFWTKRGGVWSRIFYCISWANPIVNLLWLSLIAIVESMNESATYRGWIPRDLPAMEFFVLPFLFAFCSLVLCAVGLLVKAGERRFAVCANGLMLLLWSSVIVAPN